MDDVECAGDEEHLFNCTFIQNHNCWRDEDASVNCREVNCTEGVVHLVGGTNLNETEGRVEICYAGNWYRLCNWYFSYQEARVVCKQLGYPYSGILMIYI